MTNWYKLLIGLFVLALATFLVIPSFLPDTPEQFSTILKSHNRTPMVELADLSILEVLNDRLMNLATKVYNAISPNSRLIYLPAGLRKEEISHRLQVILNLSTDDLAVINKPISIAGEKLADGYIRPGFYLFNPPFDGNKISTIFKNRFIDEVFNRYPQQTKNVIDLKKTLTIASLIEREASGSHDMPLISGIIWNRLDINMPLGLDASLQYISGTSSNWWPRSLQEIKKSTSPYNTYKYPGLPPEPISNPSDQSIMAALNPVRTNCLYYLHDKNRRIHCTATYAEHRQVIKKYY